MNLRSITLRVLAGITALIFLGGALALPGTPGPMAGLLLLAAVLTLTGITGIIVAALKRPNIITHGLYATLMAFFGVLFIALRFRSGELGYVLLTEPRQALPAAAIFLTAAVLSAMSIMHRPTPTEIGTPAEKEFELEHQTEEFPIITGGNRTALKDSPESW